MRRQVETCTDRACLRRGRASESKGDAESMKQGRTVLLPLRAVLDEPRLHVFAVVESFFLQGETTSASGERKGSESASGDAHASAACRPRSCAPRRRAEGRRDAS